jgi:hypothetical protein
MRKTGRIVGGIAAGLILAVVAGGCIAGGPTPRGGVLATSTPGTNFVDADKIGSHSYVNPMSATQGVVYTCEGGHIDLPHLRIGADWVKYLYGKSKKHLMKGDAKFNYKLNVDPSRYTVHLEYPRGWDTMNEEVKETVAEEAALELSQYLAYTMVTWHEMMTWFGFKSLGFFGEFRSAFSWEDNYSNLLGVQLGARALQDEEHSYEKAMNILVRQELEALGPVPGKVAKRETERMRGKWFEGNIMVNIKERNMDTGVDDGYVSPTLIPGACAGAKGRPLAAPTAAVMTKYGMSVRLEVEPRVFEGGRMLKIAHPEEKTKRVQIPEGMNRILDYMREEARRRGYNPMPY